MFCGVQWKKRVKGSSSELKSDNLFLRQCPQIGTKKRNESRLSHPERLLHTSFETGHYAGSAAGLTRMEQTPLNSIPPDGFFLHIKEESAGVASSSRIKTHRSEDCRLVCRGVKKSDTFYSFSKLDGDGFTHFARITPRLDVGDGLVVLDVHQRQFDGLLSIALMIGTCYILVTIGNCGTSFYAMENDEDYSEIELQIKG